MSPANIPWGISLSLCDPVRSVLQGREKNKKTSNTWDSNTHQPALLPPAKPEILDELKPQRRGRNVHDPRRHLHQGVRPEARPAGQDPEGDGADGEHDDKGDGGQGAVDIAAALGVLDRRARRGGEAIVIVSAAESVTTVAITIAATATSVAAAGAAAKKTSGVEG